MLNINIFVFCFSIISILLVFFLFLGLFVEDKKGFIKKGLSPFYLDTAIFWSSFFLVVESIGVYIVLVWIGLENSEIKTNVEKSVYNIAIPSTSFFLIIFIIFRLSLKKRIRDTGYKIGVFKEEKYEYLYVGDGCYVRTYKIGEEVKEDVPEEDAELEDVMNYFSEEEIKKMEKETLKSVIDYDDFDSENYLESRSEPKKT